jgi:hypothetical protein
MAKPLAGRLGERQLDQAVDKRVGGNSGRLGFPVFRADDAFAHEPLSPAPRKASKRRSGVHTLLI